MNWIWSLFQPFLAYSALPLPPASLCPFPTRASHRAVPVPPAEGPTCLPGPQCTAQAAGPSASRLPRDSSPMPLARAPHVPLRHPPSPLSLHFPGSPPSGRRGAMEGPVSGLTRRLHRAAGHLGGSEVRSQPTHWVRGPGAQVESLGEDVQGVCPEEGGGPETASLPAGVAGAGRGRAAGKAVETRLSACLPGAAQNPTVVWARGDSNSGDSFSHLWVRD